uniref:Conserved plasma membrane protein n=1 Tax=Mesocestoides corti TaxID=53468 RepID=A0A5K3FKG3_MESCO
MTEMCTDQLFFLPDNKMALEVTLTSVVAAIMVWAVQVENGGVLNTVFKVVPTSTPGTVEFDVSDDLMQSNIDYVMSALLLKPISLPVLEAMPESLGGGASGVANAHAHPNREPNIFWTTVALYVLIVFLIIAIQVINCCCCCCSGGETGVYGSMNPLQVAALRSRVGHKQLVCRIAYLAVLVLAVAFLAACIILIFVYFSSIGVLMSYLEAHNGSAEETSSIQNGLQALTTHVTQFMKTGIESGRTLTDNSLTDFIKNTNAEISSGLSGTIDNLLLYLSVANVLAKGGETVKALKTFSMYVTDASDSINALKGGVAALCKKMDEARDEFKNAFRTVTNCDQECQKLKTATENLYCPIDLSAIDTSVTNQFTTELQKTVADLEKKLADVNKAIKDIKASTSKMVDSIEEKLDLKTVLSSINKFWDDTSAQVGGVTKNLEDLSTSVDNGLSQYSGYIRIGFYVIGGFFIVMLVIAALIAARLLYRAFRDRLYAGADTVLTYTPGNKWDKIVCGKGSVCCCSVIFIPILLIFAAIIAVLLFALTTVSGEACIYVTRETGVNKTDFVVDGLLARRWSSLVGGSVGGANDFLNTPPPKHVLHALTQSCRGSTMQSSRRGLLSAVGYTNLVDVSKLVKSPQVQEGIKEGKKTVSDEVKKLKISSKLPSESELEKAQTDLEKAIKDLNLTTLINSTNSNLLNPAPIEKLISELTDYSNRISQQNAFEKGINILKDVAVKMKNLQPEMDSTSVHLQKVDTEKGEIIRPVKGLVEAFKTTIKAAKDESALIGEVDKQYDKVTTELLDFMEKDGGVAFSHLTQELFPCEEAYRAVNVALAVSCGDEGGLNRFVGVVYVLALTVLFICFFYFSLFNLAFMQAIQIHRLSATKLEDSSTDFGEDYEGEDKDST